jgi:toxin ParE1/3/4
VKRYRVILSPRVLRQLSAIEQWIEDEASATIARRYRQAIIAHCRKLERLPNRGSPRDDLRAALRTTVFRQRVTVG